MKVLRISVVSFLVLAAVAAGALIYQQHREEESRKSLRQYRAAQCRLENQRVAICEKRRSVLLEPSDVPPVRVDRDKGNKETLFKPPFLIYYGIMPLAQGPVSGKFVVEALIDEAGCVRQVKVLQSPNRSLDAATMATFEKWAYLPATWNHRPVRVIDTLTLNLPPDEPGVFRDHRVDEDGYRIQ
jgi:TonB family protein